ncbi:MAG: Asp-tRNA(Asn)/Glu-tRNA(Gln) amidotransferase subunit GatC [Clostridia bacterium]|nr:Asp-tRNA(Asn)/Glu-tRNA(Gln) amidotransferase GatCAB subunit C [Bacillota bacterium]MBO2522159.1 Asp-tRNA(Asn)/Glu-tRNA(Gln) amidotransferase GatCAB subunit C [Bacillota bacterium]
MAAIEREDVERVARLARLALTEEEKALFQEQLGAILEHVRALQEVDTEGVEPTPYAVQLTNVLRPDRARPSMPREQALANAPQEMDGYFFVPRILEE